ncbi:hypothetical protein G9A89_001224 [Geosiphon pyriformis]|nr:hypothetical protein G9A89_001224 [Geosiphon pyriformis]
MRGNHLIYIRGILSSAKLAKCTGRSFVISRDAHTALSNELKLPTNELPAGSRRNKKALALYVSIKVRFSLVSMNQQERITDVAMHATADAAEEIFISSVTIQEHALSNALNPTLKRKACAYNDDYDVEERPRYETYHDLEKFCEFKQPITDWLECIYQYCKMATIITDFTLSSQPLSNMMISQHFCDNFLQVFETLLILNFIIMFKSILIKIQCSDKVNK